MAKSEKGPESYENWKAALNGDELQWTLEFPLYTDAHIIAEAREGYGPYQFLNTDPFQPDSRTPLRPAIVLRFDDYRRFDLDEINMDSTDYSRYHGGELTDEIAALVSLCLGIRLKCGQITRRFDPKDKDVKGQPITHLFDNNPTLPRIYGRPVLPKVREQCSLRHISLLAKFHHLSPEQATALVKSARLYQEAIWISEASPETSWILLTSAIETAADFKYKKTLPLESLRGTPFELLEDILEDQDEEIIIRVRNLLKTYTKATKKFTDFIIEQRPSPPPERPQVQFQLSWEGEELSKSLKEVYMYRSNALHNGTPFPAPMCMSPYI